MDYDESNCQLLVIESISYITYYIHIKESVIKYFKYKFSAYHPNMIYTTALLLLRYYYYYLYHYFWGMVLLHIGYNQVGVYDISLYTSYVS